MPQRPVKIENLRKFRFVSDPQFSPDGGRIAFVLSEVNIEKYGFDCHIWLPDVASGKHRQFTFNEESDNYPRWFPDGRTSYSSQKGANQTRRYSHTS
jgi:dipeptidyl aminopeptidase/acylaminoacyl peptidase